MDVHNMSRQPSKIVSRGLVSNLNFVPTLGNATYVADLVNTKERKATGFEGLNACFIDIHSANCLARVVEGPISSLQDLQGAEAALQALLFYDHVSVLTPGIYITNQGYVRCEATRPPLAFELFKSVETSDELVVLEHANLKNGLIDLTSIDPAGPLAQKAPKELGDDYISIRPWVGAGISQTPSLYRMPAFFSDPRLQQYFGNRGFSGRLYETINRSVLDSGSVVPGSSVEVQLPIILWILLDRATSRAKILEAIVGLREETRAARIQLRELDSRMQSAVNQADREETARFFQESFDAIVKFARQTNVTRRRNKIYNALKFVGKKPIDIIIGSVNPDWKSSDPKSLVDRTITAKTFSELLRTDIASTIIQHFFSESEIRQLEIQRASQDFNIKD
jgi:hypothetical protein